jgi:oxalate decarboxylase/phosphoglucose isomerase-like protein (cupin superfamily)
VKGDLIDRVEVLKARRSADERGWLHVALGASQLPAGVSFGELYVVRANAPGDRRGDHFHRKMDEWFTLVEGNATLQLRDPATDERLTVRLDGNIPRTFRVPAGVAHCIVNDGPGPMTVVAWATAEHDPDDVIRCPTGR